MSENKERNLSTELVIRSAITNCNVIPDYRQAIIFNSSYSGFDLIGLKNYIIDKYNYCNLDIHLWDPDYMTVTNRRDRSSIDIYDFSTYDEYTCRGCRFHNIICLCPISEEIYSILTTSIVAYKNPTKAILEDKGVSW